VNDTSPEFIARYRERIEALSDGQRLLRGLHMFDDAKALLRAGIRHERPQLSEMEVEQQVFLRLYELALPPSLIDRAMGRIAERFATEDGG
jgi:hypothetical protein